MQTEKIFRRKCSKEEWQDFIAVKNSGQKFEIDEYMFFYWLEVLPPVYMNKTQEIDGQNILCSFGFAEGCENIVDFWETKGRFFGKQSNRINEE